MQSDISPSDTSQSDITFASDLTGLMVYQCDHWEQDASHGGAISDVRIFDGYNSVFPRTSLADNIAGATYYYKTFWKNVSTDPWTPFRAEVTINSSSTFARETTTVCLGDATDNMSNKPNDASFGNYTETIDTVEPGDSVPVWIRQVITAGGANPARVQEVEVQITLVAVE